MCLEQGFRFLSFPPQVSVISALRFSMVTFAVWCLLAGEHEKQEQR